MAELGFELGSLTSYPVCLTAISNPCKNKKSFTKLPLLSKGFTWANCYISPCLLPCTVRLLASMLQLDRTTAMSRKGTHGMHPTTVVIFIFQKVCGKWNWKMILFWFQNIKIHARFSLIQIFHEFFEGPSFTKRDSTTSSVNRMTLQRHFHQNQGQKHQMSINIYSFCVENLTSKKQMSRIKASRRHFLKSSPLPLQLL